jgi:hypothetical protein
MQYQNQVRWKGAEELETRATNIQKRAPGPEPGIMANLGYIDDMRLRRMQQD